MAEITLKFDARNPIAKKTIDYLLSIGVFKKVTGIEKALEDERTGNIKHYKNSKDVFKKVLG